MYLEEALNSWKTEGLKSMSMTECLIEEHVL